MKGFFRTAGNYRLRLPALLLALAMTATMLGGCREGKTTSSSSGAGSAVSDYTEGYPLPEKQRFFCGSFVQYWYASGWSEGRWEKEMQNMVDNGMDILIVPCAASRDENTDALTCYYPSRIEGMQSGNSLEILFEKCEKYGIKVFLAPFDDNEWYSMDYGWVGHDSTDDAYGQWMKEHAAMSNRIATELYTLYKAKYPNAFYGWYFSDEVWNMEGICGETGERRENTLDILASGFNGVLDHYTELDPSMPFLFSPFCNRSYSTAEEYKQMWIDLFARVRFREGDIFCPQDSIGGHPDEIDVLAEWVRGYREAADTKPGLRFWMNNENFAGEYHALLDRLKEQIDITSRFCEANVTFSWQHHYSPYHEKVNKGYEATYHDWYVNGKLDSEPPSPPTVTAAQNDDGKWQINFSGAADNIGVAGFNIYRGTDTNLATSVRAGRNTMPNKYIPQFSAVYYIEAFDFAGNRSEKVAIEVQGNEDDPLE